MNLQGDNIEYLLGAMVALGPAIYLAYALIRPERF